MATDPRLGPTPFARLAAVHAAVMCGDACVTVSLAGSLFFTAPTSAARSSVLLYLALTLAPFAVIAPLVGPALDRTRGGRRMMVCLSAGGRLALAFLLARHLASPLLYPEAFGVLVLGKTHSIAKASLVPGLVGKREGELVGANSRLALISVVAAIAGGLPAAGVVKLFDSSSYGLIMAAVAFLVGAVLALQIPRPAPEPKGETELEREELHAPSIVLAGSAFGVVRGVVGFFTFFVAFALKDSVFSLGVVLTASAIGGFLGVVIAPLVRKLVREEIILIGALLVPAVIGVVAARWGGTAAVAATALALAVGAGAGRLGFDSILQRDAPDAVRGRSFAKFETRFQLTWVAGGLFGLIPPPLGSTRIGLLCVAAVLGFFGVSYLIGLRAARTTVERRRRRAQRTRAALLDQLRLRFGRRSRAVDRDREREREPATTGREPPDAFPGS